MYGGGKLNSPRIVTGFPATTEEWTAEHRMHASCARAHSAHSSSAPSAVAGYAKRVVRVYRPWEPIGISEVSQRLSWKRSSLYTDFKLVFPARHGFTIWMGPVWRWSL